MIELPKDTEVNESPSGYWWIKNNILYSLGKKDAVRPAKEDEEKLLEDFKKAMGNKKMCMILDITYAKPSAREDRDRAAEELANLVKAMAMVSESPLGRMVANLFFGLKPPSYPVKMFSNVKDAEEWIKQYI
jgi:hypothetical protein